MSSGFQQDLNQLQPGLYRVTINMSSGSNFPTTDSGNHSDGGVTPNTWDYFSSANLPTTAATALSRARGNLRWKQIVNQLASLTDCQVLDIVMTNETNGDAQASQIDFTVKFDRDAFLPQTGSKQGTATVGNDAAGNAMNTNAKVIANTIAFAVYTGTTESMRVYDPVSGQGTQQSVTANANISLSATLALVTVSQISGTTLV
jgi:hypothetical protein